MSARRVVLALLFGSIVAIPGSAGAATINLVTTAFATPTVLENFDDGGALVIDPFFTITSTTGLRAGNKAGFTAGVTPSGDWGLTTDSFPDPIRVQFASSVLAAGLWFGNDDLCCTQGFTASLDVFGAGNVLLGTVGVVANMNDFADQFLGFTSDTEVYAMVLRYGSGTNVALFHYMDDLQVDQVVPEPASLLLLGSGLATLVARRRRRVSRL